MKWQYLVEEDETLLARLGEQGWELIAVLKEERRNRFYFKRPFPDVKARITEEQRRQVFKQFGLEEKP